MKYKEGARFGLTADEYRYVYTICQLWARQDIGIQEHIAELVTEIATPRGICTEKERELRRRALWRVLTTKAEQRRIAMDSYIDPSLLSKLVRRFYVEYARRFL